MRDAHWSGSEARRASHRGQAGPGRWNRRELTAVAVPPADWLPLPGVRQLFRVQHQTRKTRLGPTTTETLDGFPSLEQERASALGLLRLHRGHWMVEHRNHFPHDVTLGEDARRSRTGHGPSGNAALNNLALVQMRCSVRRGAADNAVGPGSGAVASGLARVGRSAAP